MLKKINRTTVSALFFLLIIPAGISYIHPGAGVALRAETHAYNGEPRTIAHDFLDMEKGLGVKKEHYATIDRLINKAAARIIPLKTYTTEQAVETLLGFDAVLKEEGFAFGNNFLLSAGLERKLIDCDNYCALYVAMAEVLKIPVIPVYAPNHSFVRFCFDDGSYLNWEPLEGIPLQDSFYVKKLRIPQESIHAGVYMKSLSRKEFIAVEHNNIGAYFMTQGKYGDSLPYLNAAIELYPRFSSAFHNRGSSYYALKKMNEAESDLLKAAKLDPSRASTRNTLGDIYFDLKEYEKAVQEYTRSIKLDPGNYVPYYSIGLIMKTIGRDDESRKWLKKAEEIKGAAKR